MIKDDKEIKLIEKKLGLKGQLGNKKFKKEIQGDGIDDLFGFLSYVDNSMKINDLETYKPYKGEDSDN